MRARVAFCVDVMQEDDTLQLDAEKMLCNKEAGDFVEDYRVTVIVVVEARSVDCRNSASSNL